MAKVTCDKIKGKFPAFFELLRGLRGNLLTQSR